MFGYTQKSIIIYVFSHHTIVVRMECKLKYGALLFTRNIDIATCIPEHSYVSVTGLWGLGRSRNWEMS